MNAWVEVYDDQGVVWAGPRDEIPVTIADLKVREVKGRKFDDEKPRWDLVPWRAMRQVVHVLTFGARKYAVDNWQHVPDRRRRYLAAMYRHVTDWQLGERDDPETGTHHLAHAICCLLFLLAEEVGYDQYDQERNVNPPPRDPDDQERNVNPPPRDPGKSSAL